MCDTATFASSLSFVQGGTRHGKGQGCLLFILLVDSVSTKHPLANIKTTGQDWLHQITLLM